MQIHSKRTGQSELRKKKKKNHASRARDEVNGRGRVQGACATGRWPAKSTPAGQANEQT